MHLKQLAGLTVEDPNAPSRVNSEYARNLVNRLQETL